ncbi:MAG: cytochrome C oxidase Cbb3 [Planctomycetota bacterium]|nr:MAG: cytochrome C oxidase Cbb3 [Planctomycetota bacterium]
MNTDAAVETRKITYDDGIVRLFIIASVAWGFIGMLVGLIAALQLSFPALNFETQWLSFGRIRPLHTNAAIFALVGNMIFAGVYYSTQRLCKVRMASDLLSQLNFWGWQLIILCAAITLPLGLTQSKEYAELEWWIDILVTLIWVVFAINYFWTLAIRNEKNLYVALWFYIATIAAIAILYIVNNLSLPVSGTKSYSLFGGAQDGLVQWWYGHNAVAFFLTTPILGIMYYFLPKAAERPVYSYRLSIVHFWALVFIYIWAGPHHLLYTSLPDWVQSLGMVFSLMLWAPSWGGMLNGLLTLRGAWNKVRSDPVLKFYVVAVTFYGMSTFEGPLLSIKSVNALGHYTDWIIAHVHGGTLGWNGFMAAGMFYWLMPRLFGVKDENGKYRLWSLGLADMHFWIGTLGILLYVVSMWVAGITHGLMWGALEPDGSLTYGDWGEIVEKIQPLYMIRSLGGFLYLAGWVLMIVNLLRTAAMGKAVHTEVEVKTWRLPADAGSSWRLIFSMPILVSAVGMLAALMLGFDKLPLAVIGFTILVLVVFWVDALSRGMRSGKEGWHAALEGRPLAFTVLTFVAVAAGGVVELLPGIIVQDSVKGAASGKAPYTALELEGRDIYIRESCVSCHSQQVRYFLSETRRYDHKLVRGPSRLEESRYDHPFLWGSKRTGPDLGHVGGKYDDAWHYKHMLNPRMIEGSNMPAYPWLYTQKVDVDFTVEKLKAMLFLGVPYSDEQIENYRADYERQAQGIIDRLASSELTGVEGHPLSTDHEIVALIAYLQKLGDQAPLPDTKSESK